MKLSSNQLFVLLAAVTIALFALVTIEEARPRPASPAPVLTPPAAELAPEPEPQDDFAEWQTYRNEEYGFEVRYPEDWTISEVYLPPELEWVKNSIFLHVACSELVDEWCEDNFQIIASTKNLQSFKQDMLDRSLDEFVTEDMISRNPSTFAGRTAEELMYTTAYGSDNKTIFFSAPPFSYQIDGLMVPEESENPTINQILSTFRFIE